MQRPKIQDTSFSAMYPYGPNSAYNQGYIGPSGPPNMQPYMQPHQVVTQRQSNDIHTETPPPPTQSGGRFKAKFSKVTQTVVPSVIACILLQAVAAFFITTADTTFRTAINQISGFSDDKNHDIFVINIVFNVFFAGAAALTAPMIKNSGYSMIVLSGSVLFIFSTMSSSLVSTARLLVLPYGIFGACSYGLLRVGSEVAMFDYLNNRRAVATALIYLGVTIGQVSSFLCFFFTDMITDASTTENGRTKWQNNMRIIEVTAVIAFMSGAVMRKPSHVLGKWPEVFKYKPFYTLNIIYFLYVVAASLFNEIATSGAKEVGIEEEHFDVHPILRPDFIYLLAQFGGVILILIMVSCCCGDCAKKYSCVIGGIAAIIIAVGSFVHEEAYDELWSFSVYTGGVGLFTAFIRVTMPLAMVYYTGRDNYKIALPFLEFSGALGGLVAYLIQAEKPDDMTTSDTWYLVGALFGVYGLGSLFTYCMYPSWTNYKAGEDSNRLDALEAVENEAYEEEEN